MLVQNTEVVTPTTWNMLGIWSSMDFKSWVRDNIHGPGNAILLSIQFCMSFRVWLEEASEFGRLCIGTCIVLIVRPCYSIGRGRHTEFV